MIFAGVGLGIAVSGTLVPLLLQQGLQESWIGLGALSAVMTAISWTNWPREANAAHSAATSRHRHQGRHSNAIRALVLEYGLNACALVPHMVFLVDFVARGLGLERNDGGYLLLFRLGGSAAALALAIDLVMALRGSRETPEAKR